MNLLAETIEMLETNNKLPDNVLWVGTKEISFTWADFVELANTEYCAGLGGQEVAKDLLIIGDGFWLERHEYDGSEWWEFKELIKDKPSYKKPRALTRAQGRILELGDCWDCEGDLKEINAWEK